MDLSLMYETIGKCASQVLMLFSAIVVVISWIDYIEEKIKGKTKDTIEIDTLDW
jgi:hypothetical protein